MRAIRFTIHAWVLTLIGLSLVFSLFQRPFAGLPNAAAPPATPTPTIAVAYGKLPLSFEANQGQSDAQVKFLSRGNDYTLFLAATEAVLQLRNGKWGPGAGGQGLETVDWQLGTDNWQLTPSPLHPVTPSSILRMHLVGANPQPQATGLDELPGKSHYFRGNDPTQWQTDVPNYAKVKYQEVYPGIDLVYYGNQRQLEYDFVVAPGVDPGVIRLAFDGLSGMTNASPLDIDINGDLILQTAAGEVRLQAPRIYQETNGGKHVIPGHYVFLTPDSGTQHIGFEVAAYDTSKPLVIDPVLVYSTYLGGSHTDFSNAIAVDATGNAYVTGLTHSTDFPSTPGAPQLGGTSHAFVTKLSPAGSLIYSAYFGGSDVDEGRDIAVDSTGDAYVTGYTYSEDFPVTGNAFQRTCRRNSGSTPPCHDTFVVKLNASGSSLIYGTYIGGSSFDEGRGIAIDSAGNAYVTGQTSSSDFPTANPFQSSPAFCSSDAPETFCSESFIAKLNPTGSALLYSTYLGGSHREQGNDIAVDAMGNVFVTGFAESTNFPTTNGAFQTAGRGAFVVKLNPLGSGLVYSTYLNGSHESFGNGIALDIAGNAYVTGSTSSTDFPTTIDAFQSSCHTTESGFCIADSFVAKLNPLGSALIYATYLGGSGSDSGSGLAVDPAGNVYLVGRTSSPDFPMQNSFQAGNGSGICGPLRARSLCPDVFVAKLNPRSSTLIYSTYLGGSGFDTGNGIAIDALGNAYVTGITSSADFPITEGAFTTTLSANDAFIAKIADVPPGIMAVFESPENGPVSGISVIRGWAFATLPGVHISSIDLFIDGQPASNLPGLRFDSIPCCAEREDVQVAFPQFPAENTLNSAWGTIFNWSLLSAGSHTVRMQIRSTTGELFVTDTRTVTVVKPGDAEFLDQFTVSGATAGIAGQEVVVEGIVVRDKATQQQKQINARFRWFTSSQSFGMVAAETVAQLSSWRSPFPALFASLSAWWQHGPAWVASARASSGLLSASLGFLSANPHLISANSGLRAVLESPQAHQPVSGIVTIHGWAFADQAGATIRTIQFMTDGQPRGSAPCCSYRGDVATAFPQNPNALDSGWGTPFNYGILPSGLHTINVQVEDSSGAVNVLTSTVEVVSVGGFEFVDQFDLSNATARIEGEEIILTGVRVRDKASQQTKTINLRLRWFVHSQALGVVASS